MSNRVLLNTLKVALGLVRSMDRRPGVYKKEEVRSILLINTTAIGDTLMTTPLIRAVRETFPRARITALAGSSARLVLQNNPCLDKIIPHPDRVNIPYFFRLPALIAELRSAGFDLAVVLHGNDPMAVPLAYLSGADFRLGLVRTEFERLLTWYRPASAKRHVIREWLDTLKVLGVETDDTRMEMHLTDEEEALARDFLKENDVEDRPIVAIHPFGSKRIKRWPVERAAELADIIAERFSWQPVILGGEKEVKDAEKLRRLMKTAPAPTTTGRLNLRVSAALIKRSVALVSTDSGPMHMAQALGVPTVALIGATLAGATGPLGTRSTVLVHRESCAEKRPCKLYGCAHVNCMNSITVEEVADALAGLVEVPA